MADRTLPDLVGSKAWRDGNTWKWSTRVIAGLTAFTFIFLQLTIPLARAEDNPVPNWLREEQGGWVPAEQAQRMNKADQELLTFLNTIQNSQNRTVSTSPSGTEALYADQNLVVARDAQGNLLWKPTLNDQGQVQDGTLLLIDGTLQTFRNGQVARQVDPFGTEVVFDAEGRAVSETAADGTRSDYSYSPTKRTTHLPNGDLVQQYDAQGRLEKVTYPDGRVFTYTEGRITSATTAGGTIYTYSQTTGADGIITVTLNTTPSGRITLPDGSVYQDGWLRESRSGAEVFLYSYTFGTGGSLSTVTVTAANGSAKNYSADGTLLSLTDPDGTRWEITAGWITRKVSPSGAVTNFSRTATPYGQQILRQAGSITDRFSFDAAGVLYAAGSDRNLSGTTPFTTPLASFNAGTLTGAGIVATDGKYLYIKPFSNSTKTFTKVGTGFGGTVAGQVYGTLTGNVSSTYSATYYSDGFLYQPDPTNASRVERIDPVTGAKAYVTIPAGLLRNSSAKVEKGDILITSDGRYVYNLSYHQTRNSTTLNGWTIRVFDPKNGWALVKEFTAGTTSFQANGFMSDGTFLYALEWSGKDTAKVAVIRISDGTVVQSTWTANQAATTVVNGQYDWVNQRFWLGAKSNGKVYAYDDPNDLALSSWDNRAGLTAPLTDPALNLSTLHLPQGYQPEIPAEFLRKVIYNTDGSVKEATQGNGETVLFVNGLPEGLSAGEDGFVLAKDNLLRNYNSTGELSSLTLADQTVLTFNGESLAGVSLPDGTKVTDGVYGADSKLISGTVTMPDGRIVRYAAGQPTEATLTDGSVVTYAAGQPTGLKLPAGLNYTLTVGPESIRADLTGTATGETLTHLTYSPEWVLLEATRADGAHLVYSGGRLSTLTEFNGTVVSYAYDDAGRLASTVAANPDPAEPVIRSEYAYDRIRKIYKGETLLYDYSYEFQPDGAEITVIREVPTGVIKRYQDGRLLSQADSDGAVTTYEYTTNPAGFEDPLSTATEAARTLSDGTIAHYSRSTAGAWALANLVLTDGTELRPEEMNPTNRLGDFASLELWSNHSPFDAPDGWKFGADIGGSIAQEFSAANVHSGSSSVKLKTGSNGGDSFIYRDIAPMYSPEVLAYSGKTITLGVWVKTSQSGAYLTLLDGVVAPSRSTNHPGDGQWHFLTVTHTAGAEIPKLVALLITSGPNTTAYMEDAVVILGPAALMGSGVLLTEATLPSDPAELDRMVELGMLQLSQPASSEPIAEGPTVLARSTFTYQGKERESFTYRYSDGLTHITGKDGVTRSYDSSNQMVALEQADGVRYEVSTHRDLSEAQVQQISALNPGDAAVAAVLSNPNGEEIIVQHRIAEEGQQLAPDTIVERVFDSNGGVISTTQANGQTTLYEDDRPIRTFDSQGRLLTEYTYDEEGRLIKISLVGARRDLANEIAAARADLARKEADALQDLAQRRGLSIQDLRVRADAARAELSNQMNSLKIAWSNVLPIDPHGRAGEQAKAGAMNQILDAQAQVYVALSEVDTQYAQALGQLEAQVESVRQQVQTESASALADINSKEVEFGLQILRQEISTIVISTYRNTIGRDPSQQELQAEAQRLYDRYGTDPEAAVDLAELTQRISTLSDYQARATQVAAVKQAVTAWLTHYAQSPADRAQLVEALGLAPDQVVTLSDSDITRIVEWLNSRSLHFGHSAFLALQEYMASQNVQADPTTLAVEAILTDILIGVITPKVSDQADLEISLFTLGRLAQRHGAAATAARVKFEDLTGLLAAGSAIAHVNGNHYIVVKTIAADGTVTYSEPNAGPNGEVLTMTRAEFEKSWDGAILAARAPPHAWQVLTDSEAQKITGSFFPLIFLALAWIGTAITTAVSVVVGAIAAIIGTLSAIVSSIFSIVGTIFSSIGSFLGGFGSFFSGFGAISQGLGGIFAGNLLGGLSAIAQGIAVAIPGGALGIGLNIGVTKGLEALGVSPTIASLAGAFVSGGVTGALNPVNVSSSFLSSFVSSGLTSTAIAGTQIGLVKAGLDPALAGIASIGVGTIAGSMLSGINVPKLDPVTGNPMFDQSGHQLFDHLSGTAALGHTLSTQLAPTLAGELAFYGVQKLGESIGLDPRISQLAGMPIKGVFNPQAFNTTDTFTAIQRGLMEGATSIGLQKAAQSLDLDPLTGAVVTRALSGAVSGALSQSGDVFTGAYGAFLHSAGNFSVIPPPPDPEDPRFITTLQNGTAIWNQAAYNQAVAQYEASRPVWMAQAMAKTNNFSDEIRQLGFAQAIEDYAASIFHRDSVESLVQSFGTVKDAIIQRVQQGKVQDVTLPDGSTAKEISLSDDEDLSLLYRENALGDVSLLGVTEDDLEYLYQEIRADRQTLQTGMASGTIIQRQTDGTQIKQTVSQGEITRLEIIKSDGSKTVATPLTGERSLVFQDRAQTVSNEQSLVFLNRGTVESSNYRYEIKGGLINDLSNTYYFIPPEYLIGQGFEADDVVELTVNVQRTTDGQYTSQIQQGRVLKNYFVDARVAEHDIFGNVNLQTENPLGNAFLRTFNSAANMANYLFNVAFNINGYIQDTVDRLTGTTLEERVAASASTPLPVDDAIFLGLSTIDRSGNFIRALSLGNEIVNPLPQRFARAVPRDVAEAILAGEDRTLKLLGERAFVTAAEDVAGINKNLDLSKRLTIVDEAGNLLEGPWGILEFDATGINDIASPVFQKIPGFIGGGKTLGGAREYTIPNLKASELKNLTVRIVRD